MGGIRKSVALLCLALTSPALAAVQHPAQLSDPRWLEPPRASDALEDVRPGGATPAAHAARNFVERHGGQWTFRTDPRSGRLAVISGSGIPLSVGHADAVFERAEDAEPLVAAFIERNADWLSPPVGRLAYDAEHSQARHNGRLVSVRYGWRVDDIPVEGAGVFVGINHGNITRVAVSRIGDIAIRTTPQIGAKAATRIALNYAGNPETTRMEAPQLRIEAEDTPANGRAYRLVWVLRHVALGRIETWETRIDAATGSVVGFRDINQYGRAVGGVYPNSIIDHNERRVPFPGLRVEVDGRSLTTDSAGAFGYTGGTAITLLDGTSFDTHCVQCTNPAQPLERKHMGTGRLDLGLFGHDQNGNGISTAADRNTFYHLTQARRIAIHWLPELRWLGWRGFPANVNLPLECNAFFDGRSVNLYRSGGGCNNSGLIRDVIQHEWGHGLDSATLLADGASGEGTADVTALHLGHDPVLAPGFFLDGGPVRVLDAANSPLGLLTRTRVNFGDCERPLGGISVHCVGQLYGQAAWELSRALIERHGHHTGWRVSERLFFESLPDAGSLFPETPMSIYDAYLQADDDDGNLANGTPHAAEIHAAFARHQIAGAALPASPHCDRPAQPVVTVAPGCRSIDVAWEDVPRAVGYRVLRSELRQDSALFPIARVPAGQPGFVDTAVAPDFDYAYVVVAMSDDGCESTLEDPVAARLAAGPVLSVSAVSLTDAPRGNRSGFADPGEEIDLLLTLANDGSADATAVEGTLRALSAGVSVIAGRAHWPDVPAGQSRAAAVTTRLRADADLACGDLLRLAFVPDPAAGCGHESSFFSVRIGRPHGRGDYVCDRTPPCYAAPSFAGLEQAGAGASCGETVLSWQPAVGHCADATVTYDIFRSSDADFTPGPDSLLVARHPAATFVDTQLTPGATYHYAVRAYDSRAGYDGNAVVLAATAPTRPDVRAPEFSGLTGATTGTTCGEVNLSWPASRESCSPPVTYDVYRSLDPAFEAEPQHRIASTQATSFTDFAPHAGRDYTYIVRARDAAGNADANRSAATATARNLDRIVVHTPFETSAAGWRVVAPNDALRGHWEWGDPEGTSTQPEDDATVAGIRAWITGLVAFLPDGNNNDVDHGTTTLLSIRYDLSDSVDPSVRYMRWFTNDRAQNPGDPRDRFLVHASNDDGLTWRLLEEVGGGTPLEWVQVELPLAGTLRPTNAMRFRFTAADPGFSLLDASSVEAGIDEFELIDRGQGCVGCPAEATLLDSVRVERAGDDLVLSWEDDPALGAGGRRFIVERVVGGDPPQRLGLTAATAFTISGAAADREAGAFRVRAVGGCAQSEASSQTLRKQNH